MLLQIQSWQKPLIFSALTPEIEGGTNRSMNLSPVVFPKFIIYAAGYCTERYFDASYLNAEFSHSLCHWWGSASSRWFNQSRDDPNHPVTTEAVKK